MVKNQAMADALERFGKKTNVNYLHFYTCICPVAVGQWGPGNCEALRVKKSQTRCNDCNSKCLSGCGVPSSNKIILGGRGMKGLGTLPVDYRFTLTPLNCCKVFRASLVIDRQTSIDQSINLDLLFKQEEIVISCDVIVF